MGKQSITPRMQSSTEHIRISLLNLLKQLVKLPRGMKIAEAKDVKEETNNQKEENEGKVSQMILHVSMPKEKKAENRFPELKNEGTYPEELPPLLSSDDEDDEDTSDVSTENEVTLGERQVNERYKDAMQEIVNEFKSVFAGPLGQIKFGSHRIRLVENAHLVFLRPYRLSPKER